MFIPCTTKMSELLLLAMDGSNMLILGTTQLPFLKKYMLAHTVLFVKSSIHQRDNICYDFTVSNQCYSLSSRQIFPAIIR